MKQKSLRFLDQQVNEASVADTAAATASASCDATAAAAAAATINVNNNASIEAVEANAAVTTTTATTTATMDAAAATAATSSVAAAPPMSPISPLPSLLPPMQQQQQMPPQRPSLADIPKPMNQNEPNIATTANEKQDDANLRLPIEGQPYIDAKNTLQSHSVLAEFAAAAQESTLLLSLDQNEIATSAKRDEHIVLDHTATTTDHDSESVDNANNGFYKQMLLHTGGALNQHDSVSGLTDNTAITRTGAVDDSVVVLPLQETTRNERLVVVDRLPTIGEPPTSSNNPTISAQVATIPAAATAAAAHMLIIEAQYLYEPDGQRVGYGVAAALPMQAALGEVTSDIAMNTAAADAATDNGNDVESSSTTALPLPTGAVATGTTDPQLKGAVAMTVLPKWKQRRQCRLRAIVVSLLLLLIGSLLSTLLAPNRHNHISSSNESVDTVNDTLAAAERQRVIVEFINNITLSSQDVQLLDKLSASTTNAEAVTLRWLVHDDPLQLSLNDGNDFSSAIKWTSRFYMQQRFAVATLWALPSRFGPGYAAFEQHECNWTGITCAMLDLAVDENGDGSSPSNETVRLQAVTHIQLANSGWTGRMLRPDLGLLSNSLVHFDMSGNDLTGTLPERALQAWTKLQHFNIAANRLGGTWPTWIAERWSELEYFNINSNGEDGLDLSAFDDENNGENGGFTSGFTGSLLLGSTNDDATMDIHSVPKASWTKLKHFDVSRNAFDGSLSAFMGNWTSLEYVDISRNQLSGSLPASIGQWTQLQTLVAFRCNLTGPLPTSIGQWRNLTLLDVSLNALTGSLPASIGQWTNLATFDINSNALNGTLPSTIGEWTKVENVNWDDNAFTGSIPSSIAHWSNLRGEANLFSDKLGGSIPLALCNNTALTYISIQCALVDCSCGSDKCGVTCS